MQQETLLRGFNFFLPEIIERKDVSVIEVGPFPQQGLANELNKFFGTEIETLNLINSYLLVHPEEMKGLETLLTGTPFVDPIMHQGTLNDSLALELGLPFDYVLQSMLNPGTSDAQGSVALNQAFIALGHKPGEGDLGFLSKQYLLKSDNISAQQLEQVSGFLANPDLNLREIIVRSDYERGRKIQVPVVTLPPKVVVEKYDVASMNDAELMKLNSERRLAGNLEEMHQFRDQYKDKVFLAKRKESGLDHRATDVELETWFGLRSEHCFHKEFNAHITLEDLAYDELFTKTMYKGDLKVIDSGELTLEDGIFKTFIERPAKRVFQKLEKRGKNWISSMFEDNSGVVLYDENFMFAIKFETHNSPSNKEPVQGAKTGIDGVNRDIFGTERGTFDALSNFFFYCTGNPDYEGWLPQGVKHPYVLLKGVTQGVREGGNESQIPTLGGGLITDPRYVGKVLVYAGTIGWSPVKSPDGVSYIGKNPNVGDLVFVAGQPVGVDGVHGATESSLIADKNISLGHVQADFSFIQAKMKEYILNVARDNLLTTITDFGAMGLGSASHETASATGGLLLDLEKHPKKYAGIQPWQINASETQDRMLLVSKPETKEELMRRAELFEVEVTEVGTLTDSGFVHMTYGDETVGLIDIEKLFNKEPRKEMHATWYPQETIAAPEINGKYSLEDYLCMVMEQPDVASKEWFFRQKDSSVKGATIIGPLLGVNQEVEADATMQKPLDTEGKDFGAIAYSLGISPKVSDLDPYHAAQKSYVDMIGKVVALGGKLPDMDEAQWDAWAVCGNYCQPNSESKSTLTKESGEHNLASLIREGMGIADAIDATNIPVISGKDSMKCSCRYEVAEDFKLEDVPADLRRHTTLVKHENGKKEIEIHDPDTYLASAAVKIDDYRKCVTPVFKQEGDMIYSIGFADDTLGASQLYQALGYHEDGAPKEGGVVPKANLDEFIEISGKMHSAVDNGLLASSNYIHNGGLITSIAKAAIAGEFGAHIDAPEKSANGFGSQNAMLFSESPGRFMVSIDPKNQDEFESLMGNTPYERIGFVTAGNLTVSSVTSVDEVSLSKVKESYQKPLSFGLQEMKNG